MRELLRKYPLGYEGYLLGTGGADLAAVESNRDIMLQGMEAVATLDAGQQGVGEDMVVPQLA